MTKQLAASLLFIGISLMVCLATLSSSGFFAIGSLKSYQSYEVMNATRQTEEQEDKPFKYFKDITAGWDEGDTGGEHAGCSDSKTQHQFEEILSKLRENGTIDLDSKLFAPSYAYEKTRRKVEKGVEEIWHYIRSQFSELNNSIGDKNIKAKLDQILELGGEQHRSIATDIHYLSQVDCYSAWRQRELKELSDVVQQRLFYLQNPKDCSSARKVVCDFKVPCGFGCQAHHVSYCMIMAYGTGRTLILHSKRWSYAKDGWEKFFLPLSETCLDDSGKTTANWGDASSNEDVQVLRLPIVGYLPQNVKPDFLPLAIPEDISPKLMMLHGYPAVWWIGQIMKFIMRPQPDIKEYIKNKTAAIGFAHPIVGIHVRRTDKLIREAKFHKIEEYMMHAEEFYQRLERKKEVPVRRIYLATDEPRLLEEARKKYPNYVFVSDNAISKSAATSSRFTEHALKGFLLDIHLLARSDFLVCTFTSNVGRLAYEMMQDRHEDAAAKALSVDSTYYYHGQNDRELKVQYENKPRGSNETELCPGDTLILNGDHSQRDGYSKGINPRLKAKKDCLFPTYKVEDNVKIVKMPTYPRRKTQ